MEFPDPKLVKETSEIEGDSAADRTLSASTTEASTREERASLLTLARSGFVRSDTTIGADGKIDILPIFPTLTTAASVLEFKQKNDLRNARPVDATASKTTADSDLTGPRSRLTELAIRSMIPEDVKALTDSMKAFEVRARERGLPDKEVASTYSHVSRLLEATGETPLTTDRRHRLALQVAAYAAVPTDISQGINSTCSVASIESAVYTINPSDAARIVVDIATTGRHTTRTGHEIVVDPSPRTEAARYEGIRRDGDREHASEIFQITAANVFYRSTGQTFRYDQVPTVGTSDSGERLFDTAGLGVMRDFPGLSDGDIAATARLITGHDRIGVIHSEGYARSHPIVDKAASLEELNTLLLRAKEEGRLPLIVRVNAVLEPFARYGSDLKPADLTTSGVHVVTITDYHPGPPPKVNLDNSWKERDDFLGDKRLSVEDLWKGMQLPKTALKLVQRQVDALRAAGSFDPQREAELLRLQATHGNLSEDLLLAATERFWERFSEHCRKDNSCTPADIKVREAAYRRLFAALPPL